MTAENQNSAALVRSFWETWNKGDWDTLQTLVAPGYVHHVGESKSDLDAFKQGTARVLNAMPDYQITPQQVVAEGDTVAVRWIGRGTHRGSYMGESPTNKEVIIHGMHVHHIADGRIQEDWELIDNLNVAQQVGLIPSATI